MVSMDMRDVWEWNGAADSASDAWDAASPEQKHAVRAFNIAQTNRPHPFTHTITAEGCSEPSDRLLVSNVEVSRVVSISTKKASKANLTRWFSKVFGFVFARMMGK